jgi:hypothetical protein
MQILNYWFMSHRPNTSPLVLLQEHKHCFTDEGCLLRFPVAQDGIARPIASS